MDQLPVCFAGHRVGILLAKKPDIRRLFQLIHRSRITSELPVIELDRANIFVPAMNRFHLAIAAQIESHLGGGDAQSQHHQKHKHDYPDEHKALLVVSRPVVLVMLHRRHLVDNQRERLPVVVRHVFYQNRICRDRKNTIPPLHNVAILCEKNIFPVQQKSMPLSIRRGLCTEEL